MSLSQKEITILNSMKLDQALRLAKKRSNEGKFDEETKIYSDILVKFPKNKGDLQGIRVSKEENEKNSIDNQHSISAQIQLILKLYNQGQYREVLGEAAQALKSFPESELLHNILGAANMELQQFEVAIKCYRKAIKIKPDYAGAYYNLGNALNDKGDSRAAIEAYKKALLIQPDYFEALSNMGAAQHLIGELEAAIKSYHRAIRIQPESSKSYNNLGCIFMDQGNFGSAIASYKKAIQIESNYTEAYYNLGEVFTEKGLLLEAQNFFKKALSLDPKDKLGAKIKLASLGERAVPESIPEHYLKQFYKNRAQTWGENNDQYNGHTMVRKAIQQTKPKASSLKILDLGCGTGTLASFLLPYADALEGVDISPEMLDRAKKTKLYDNLYEQDLTDFLSNTKSCFDLVVASAVMIHFLNLETIFKLVRGRLSLNGSFVFSIFKATKEQKELNSFMMYSHSDDYIRHLAASLNFKVFYYEQGIHEYHGAEPVDGLVYVLKKTR